MASGNTQVHSVLANFERTIRQNNESGVQSKMYLNNMTAKQSQNQRKHVSRRDMMIKRSSSRRLVTLPGISEKEDNAFCVDTVSTADSTVAFDPFALNDTEIGISDDGSNNDASTFQDSFNNSESFNFEGTEDDNDFSENQFDDIYWDDQISQVSGTSRGSKVSMISHRSRDSQHSNNSSSKDRRHRHSSGSKQSYNSSLGESNHSLNSHDRRRAAHRERRRQSEHVGDLSNGRRSRSQHSKVCQLSNSAHSVPGNSSESKAVESQSSKQSVSRHRSGSSLSRSDKKRESSNHHRSTGRQNGGTISATEKLAHGQEERKRRTVGPSSNRRLTTTHVARSRSGASM